MKKMVVISLDGVPLTVLKSFLERGLMPNLKKVIAESGFDPVEIKSVHPCESATAWTSYMTGNNPGKHNIYGFVDRHVASEKKGMYIVNSSYRDGDSLWKILSDNDLRPVAINVPLNFPPENVNGVVVGGFLSPPGNKGIVHPPRYEGYLNEVGYKPDPDNSLVKKDLHAWYEDLVKTESVRIDFSKKIFQEEEWDFFHLHVMGTDRLHHFLWEKWEDDDPFWRKKFEDFYSEIDSQIAWFFEKGKDCTFVMLSDHGFCGTRYELDLNAWLIERSLLKLEEGSSSFSPLMLPETKAFSLLPGRIYLNLKGRENFGTVSKKDYESIREKVRLDLLQINDPSGKKVFRDVYNREDVYFDNFSNEDFFLSEDKKDVTKYDLAPDLICFPEDGIDLKASFESGSEVFSHSLITGMHTFDNAFLWVSDKQAEEGSILDIAPSVLKRMKIKFRMDGKVIF